MACHGVRHAGADASVGHDMRKQLGVVLRAAAVALSIFSAPLGCEKDGPAERAGEEVDEAVDDAKDAVD